MKYINVVNIKKTLKYLSFYYNDQTAVIGQNMVYEGYNCIVILNSKHHKHKIFTQSIYLNKKCVDEQQNVTNKTPKIR